MDVRPLFVSHIVEGLSQAEIPNVGFFSRRASSPSGLSPSVKGKKSIAQGRAPLSAKDSAACHSNSLNHILSTQALKPAINSQTHLSSAPSPKTSSHGASNCDEHEGRFTFFAGNEMVQQSGRHNHGIMETITWENRANPMSAMGWSTIRS